MNLSRQREMSVPRAESKFPVWLLTLFLRVSLKTLSFILSFVIMSHYPQFYHPVFFNKYLGSCLYPQATFLFFCCFSNSHSSCLIGLSTTYLLGDLASIRPGKKSDSSLACQASVHEVFFKNAKVQNSCGIREKSN